MTEEQSQANGEQSQAAGPAAAAAASSMHAPAADTAQTGDAARTSDAAQAGDAADAPASPTSEPAAVASPKTGEAPAPRPTPATIPPPAVPTPAAVARAAGAPVPKPPAPGPAAASPAAAAPAVESAEPSLDPAEVEAATKFGKVDQDGTVSVLEAGGERVVGQYPDVSTEEALSLYIRRFLDLKAQVQLFAARLETLSARDLDASLAKLDEALKEPAAVGDLDSLRATVEELRGAVTERKKALAKQREEARKKALAERTKIVERAEEIAATDPKSMQWRPQGDRLRSLLDEWKAAQRTGARIDKPTEDELWKRFSTARSTFDRNRRQFFADLDRKHGEAKAVKEKLIERAEALQHSTDWGPTSAAYRQLMDEWKAAGRASRKDDDALWARFRAAQDVFFQARQSQNEALDAEYAENLKVKLALLERAEALLPIKDIDKAKSALREIQDAWEDAGRVPRGDVKSVEGRLRAVEQAVRNAEDAEWSRTNPQLQERAEGAAAQLHAAIAGLEEDLKKAEASGDTRKITRAREALEARRAWLAQVLKAAEDAS